MDIISLLSFLSLHPLSIVSPPLLRRPASAWAPPRHRKLSSLNLLVLYSLRIPFSCLPFDMPQKLARVSFVRHQLRSWGVRFRWRFLFLWSLGEFAAAVYGGCSLFLEFKEWICDFRFSDLSLGSHPPCGRDLSASVKLLSWWCCLAAVVVFEVLFGVVEVQFLPNAVEWAPEVSTSSEASLGSSYAGEDGDSVSRSCFWLVRLRRCSWKVSSMAPRCLLDVSHHYKSVLLGHVLVPSVYCDGPLYRSCSQCSLVLSLFDTGDYLRFTEDYFSVLD